MEAAVPAPAAVVAGEWEEGSAAQPTSVNVTDVRVADTWCVQRPLRVNLPAYLSSWTCAWAWAWVCASQRTHVHECCVWMRCDVTSRLPRGVVVKSGTADEEDIRKKVEKDRTRFVGLPSRRRALFMSSRCLSFRARVLRVAWCVLCRVCARCLQRGVPPRVPQEQGGKQG